MVEDAGSYAFGNFSENQAELERLQRQATVAIKLESGYWKKFGLKPGMKVLDLASGPGLVTCALAEFVTPGTVVGVDISPELIQIAELHRREHNIKNVKFQPGNIYEKNSIPGSYDWVYVRFLFQHLKKPQVAAGTIFSCLKPGGMVCILDVDDKFLAFFPGSDEFDSFTQMAAQGQTARGGDRYVGRKLGMYLEKSGFIDIKTEIIPVTSNMIGVRNFLDLTTGFKKEQFDKRGRAEAEKKLSGIYQAGSASYAWGGVGVFAVTARRPST